MKNSTFYSFIDRQPKKGRRVCFLRNMDSSFGGILLTVSKKHYRRFVKLLDAITLALTPHVVINSAVRRIYRVDGTKIVSLDAIYEGDVIVCCCRNETFASIGYNINRDYVKQLRLQTFNGNENESNFKEDVLNGDESILKSDSSESESICTKDSSESEIDFWEDVPNEDESTCMENSQNENDSISMEKLLQPNQLSEFKTALSIFSENASNEDKSICKEDISKIKSISWEDIPKSTYEENSFNLNDDATEEFLPPNQLPQSITLYIDVIRCIEKSKKSAIFTGKGRANSDLNYIIKMVSNKHMYQRSGSTYAEIEILRKLQRHENIIELIYTVEQKIYTYIVIEQMSCDLFDMSMNCSTFSERFVQHVMIEVAKGLEYIHSCQIIHRDIKLENIFVHYKNDSDSKTLDVCVIKIGDFGTATLYKGQDLYQRCGTTYYMAPELTSYEGYDFRVDCWSLGVTLFFLLCQQYPFGNGSKDKNHILECIQRDVHVIPPKYVIKLSIEAQHLINSLLDKSRHCRISATEIRRHAFLRLHL